MAPSNVAKGRRLPRLWIEYNFTRSIALCWVLTQVLTCNASPHFSRPRVKCAKSSDPAAAGSGLAANAFGLANFPIDRVALKAKFRS